MFQMWNLRPRKGKSLSPRSLVNSKVAAVIHKAQKPYLSLTKVFSSFFKGKS